MSTGEGRSQTLEGLQADPAERGREDGNDGKVWRRPTDFRNFVRVGMDMRGHLVVADLPHQLVQKSAVDHRQNHQEIGEHEEQHADSGGHQEIQGQEDGSIRDQSEGVFARPFVLQVQEWRGCGGCASRGFWAPQFSV